MSEQQYRIVYANLDGLPAAVARIPGVDRGVSSIDGRLADGVPVIVDAGGFPVEELLAFFVSKVGTRSTTLAQYARALVGFCEFLQYRGIPTLLDARAQDLVAYRVYRTVTMAVPISDYSFRPEASALRQFYAWAIQSGRLRHGPVKALSRNGRDNLSTNRIRHSKIRHVDTYLLREFLRTAGHSDGHVSIRSAYERNVAAIKTFTTTGLRLQELGSLLTLDIDHAIGMRRAISVEMESITKYQVNRSALIPFYAMDAIRRYRKTERPNVVHRHQRALTKRLDQCFVVDDFDVASRRVSGSWRGQKRRYLLHLVPVELRLNAVSVKPDGRIEPLCLFLSDSRGLGMTRSGWEGVFSGISDQMIRQYPADNRIRKVTPHDLRHTFAINYLLAALKDRAKALDAAALGDRPPIRDPLIDLQELLGHSTSAQTLGYLRYVEDIDRVVAAAVPDGESSRGR